MRDSRFLPQRCTRASEWVSLQLDGELSELELALLRTHLERCPRCATFAHSVESITSTLRAAPLEHPGRTFNLPVPLRRFSRPGALRVASAATAALAAAAAMTVSVALRKSEPNPLNPRVPAANMSSADLTELRVIRRAQLHLARPSLNAVRARHVVT
jgi:anti-sigma factor RsiW